LGTSGTSVSWSSSSLCEGVVSCPFRWRESPAADSTAGEAVATARWALDLTR
jgi:hypothetical protein